MAGMPRCITPHCQLGLDEVGLDLLHPEHGLDIPDVVETVHLGSSPRRPWILGSLDHLPLVGPSQSWHSSAQLSGDLTHLCVAWLISAPGGGVQAVREEGSSSINQSVIRK